MNELVICVLMMNQYPTLFLWHKEETLLSKPKIYKKNERDTIEKSGFSLLLCLVHLILLR